MSRLWLPQKAGSAAPLARTRSIETATAEPSWHDGYAEGLEEGHRLARGELAGDRAALAEMVARIDALRPPSREHLAALIAEVVARLVTQVAGAAAVDEALLAARACAAADALADEAGDIALHVHPDDAVMLADALPYAVMADAAMARGSVRAEAGDGWAADGVQEALARVLAALGR